MRRYIYSLATDQSNRGIDRIFKVILRGCSLLYKIAVNLRNILYDRGLFASYNVGVPVISIGNITMGGSGKTPLVIFMAQWLQSHGFKPVVLIRGYMNDATKDTISDEVKLLNKTLKDVVILQDPDRVASARRFLKEDSCDVFILDDGFQHRKIHRDLNIVAVDMSNPFGNDALIPRGILREPLGAFRRSDMIVFTRSDLGQQNIDSVKSRIMGINPRIEFFETVHRPVGFIDLKDCKSYDVSVLKGISALAFCAIGNPDGFKGTLKQTGLKIFGFEIYEDHHIYTESDIHRLVSQCKKLGTTALVTTSKDAVKLQTYLDKIPDQIRILYLEITIEVTHGQEQFNHRINRLLQR
ncbi:MAG: tetraacyldisaccharide 4'-kinase [Candidatus Omnitrophota bacterium]